MQADRELQGRRRDGGRDPATVTAVEFAHQLNRGPVRVRSMPAWLARLLGRVLSNLPAALVEVMLRDLPPSPAAAATTGRFGIGLRRVEDVWHPEVPSGMQPQSSYLTEGRILGPAPVGSKVPIAPGYPAVSRSALSRQCHEARGRILRVGELGGPREYRRDIKAAWERVQAVPSRTFEASLGPVEYALEGGSAAAHEPRHPGKPCRRHQDGRDVCRDRLDGHRAGTPVPSGQRPRSDGVLIITHQAQAFMQPLRRVADDCRASSLAVVICVMCGLG